MRRPLVDFAKSKSSSMLIMSRLGTYLTNYLPRCTVLLGR
jgi:hypothetical protein